MTNLISMNSLSLTMTLKEITDLLEVRHNDAMKTVEKLSKNKDFGELRKIRSSYKNNLGVDLPLDTYELDERQSIAVASRLNTSLLMRVIDRWKELELNNKPIKEYTELELARNFVRV